jgi:NAD(P)-dependent dehydrogenase (short-subunit alcohol dehydrogenase family)
MAVLEGKAMVMIGSGRGIAAACAEGTARHGAKRPIRSAAALAGALENLVNDRQVDCGVQRIKYPPVRPEFGFSKGAGVAY